MNADGEYHLSSVAGVSHIAPTDWDALVGDSDPFLEHAFLLALESSGSVGARSGWTPQFVLCHRGGSLVGAVPLYLKDNSYGEFIFDWAWAGGADQAGIDYYPKLVAAIPFTPATGDRILVRDDADRAGVVPALLRGIDEVAKETGASSVHMLFCRETESAELATAGYHARLSFQFHWENRTPQPYGDFEDFLGALRSQSRKQVRKERKRARDHGLDLVTVAGAELRDDDWQALENLYLHNASLHGSIPYLRPGFFTQVRKTLPHRVVATLARDGDRVVAGTLNFQRGHNLFGRYWGTTVQGEMLHFELCYYALIEHAIKHGHTRFEAGAQGEHKLKRGLSPTLTHSAHRIFHPGLDRAIGGFIRQEAHAVKERVAEYSAHTPYHK